jgi:hypothetical protein
MNFAQDQSIEWPSGQSFNITPFEEIFLFKPQMSQITPVPK